MIYRSRFLGLVKTVHVNERQLEGRRHRRTRLCTVTAKAAFGPCATSDPGGVARQRLFPKTLHANRAQINNSTDQHCNAKVQSWKRKHPSENLERGRRPKHN